MMSIFSLQRGLRLLVLAAGLTSIVPLVHAELVLVNNNGQEVAEGGSVVIGPANLRVEDPVDPYAEIVYSVVHGPSHGGLYMSNIGVTSFTQWDINDGRVTYIHYGDEEPVDFFVFSVDDGVGGSIPNEIFTLTILPVDDPLVVTRNTGLDVCAVCPTAITIAEMLVTDADSPTGNLDYTVILEGDYGDILVGGQLAYNFTQYDLEHHRVAYEYHGTGATRDVAAFIVNANENPPGPGIEFELRINLAGLSAVPELPETRFRIASTVPNPFNPATTLRVSLPREERIDLGVYDLAGRLVARVFQGWHPAGEHEFTWAGTDASGARVASGVYVVRLTGDAFTEAKKIVMLK